MKPKGKRIVGKLLSPIYRFINDSRAVGITLIACTLFSLTISNSGLSAGYLDLWNAELGNFSRLSLPHTFLHIINDALMAVFFLLVGMEIKRELLEGELSDFRKASLPIFAALGGMLIPASFYLLINRGSGFEHGWGIPMATDIAFALGVLSLLGNRVPVSLKILLAALAIIDDLGAIIAIAIFYTDEIRLTYLLLAGLGFALLLLFNKLKVNRLYFYFIPGLAIWYCMFNSGVHATLAGVLLAATIPLQKIPKLETKLHHPVSFIILPLFALANTAIVFPEAIGSSMSSTISYGVIVGLFLGKPIGITLISFLAVKSKIAKLPGDISWKHVLGTGLIAGIGFTMSIFISMLAFTGVESVESQTTAKLAVLLASVIAGIAGFLFLSKLSTSASSSSKTTG